MKSPWRDTVLALGSFVLTLTVIGCSGAAVQPPEELSERIQFPKGASIYVRLQQPISSATAEAGQSFPAVLDEPIIAARRIFAPEGSLASVRVVAARKPGHNPGYLRVTLASVIVNGKEVPVQTNNLLVEGGSFKKHSFTYLSGGSGFTGNAPLIGSTDSKEVGFAADQRMGFRLSESLNLGD